MTVLLQCCAATKRQSLSVPQMGKTRREQRSNKTLASCALWSRPSHKNPHHPPVHQRPRITHIRCEGSSPRTMWKRHVLTFMTSTLQGTSSVKTPSSRPGYNTRILCTHHYIFKIPPFLSHPFDLCTFSFLKPMLSKKWQQYNSSCFTTLI
jgi:hypothetical protein